MGKSIVVFFSHAGDNYAVGNIEVGNTKIVADYITELTGADQFDTADLLPVGYFAGIHRQSQESGQESDFGSGA